MDDLNISVLQGFSLRAKRIIKEKSNYIVNTDKGILVIKKSFEKAERITFAHEIKEHLNAQGFCFCDRFILSNTLKPYVEFDGDCYTATFKADIRTADFSDKNTFKNIVNQTAVFHNLAQGAPFSNRIYTIDDNICEQFQKDLSELSMIKKKISMEKRLSDFDVLFLKNYSFYTEKLEHALKLLSVIDTKKHILNARNKKMICHDLLKEENLLVDNETIFIVNFSHAAIGHSVFDLCNLIRRYTKNLPQNHLTVNEILEIYNEQNPISGEELDMLYPLLLYPYKFVRICNQYYSKKRTWTPSAIENRMQTVLENKDLFYTYIGNEK